MLPLYKLTKTARKVAVIGSGMSLNNVDFNNFKNDGYVICINDAWRKFRDPDIVVSIDTVKLVPRFTDCPHKVVIAIPPDFKADKYNSPRKLLWMRREQNTGLSDFPSVLHAGENSGYGAFNLAYLLKPEKIFLFGIDLVNMGHHSHPHSDPRIMRDSTVTRLPGYFETAVPQIEAAGIKVVNGSPISKITCFPKTTPEEAIERWNAA